MTKKTKLNLLFKLSYLNSNFALTLGYLNPALNNPAQGSVVRRPVSSNLGLNLNPGFFFFSSKSPKHSVGQFSLFFLQYPIIKLKAKRIKLDLFFKLSYPSSNFALTLGYLNPASNNPAQLEIPMRS